MRTEFNFGNYAGREHHQEGQRQKNFPDYREDRQADRKQTAMAGCCNDPGWWRDDHWDDCCQLDQSQRLTELYAERNITRSWPEEKHETNCNWRSSCPLARWVGSRTVASWMEAT